MLVAVKELFPLEQNRKGVSVSVEHFFKDLKIIIPFRLGPFFSFRWSSHGFWASHQPCPHHAHRTPGDQSRAQAPSAEEEGGEQVFPAQDVSAHLAAAGPRSGPAEFPWAPRRAASVLSSLPRPLPCSSQRPGGGAGHGDLP